MRILFEDHIRVSSIYMYLYIVEDAMGDVVVYVDGEQVGYSGGKK